MNRALHHWLDPVLAQQDYLWFLLVLAWVALLAGASWRRGETSAAPGWLVALGLTQLVIGAVTIARGVFPPADAVVPPVGWELAIDLATAATGLVLTRYLTGWSRWVWAWAILGGAVWQALQPITPGQPTPLSGAWVSLAGFGAVVASYGRASSRRAGAPSQRTAGWLFVAALASQDGLLAEMADEPRRWAELSLFALPAVLAGLGVVASTASDWAGLRCRDLLRHPEWRQVRDRAAVWLLLGLVLAAASGWVARRSFERGLLSRAEAYTVALDRALLERWFGERFALTERKVGRNWFRTFAVYRAPATMDPDLRPSRAYLALLERQDPDATYAHLATLRADEIVGAVIPFDGHGDDSLVILHGPAGDDARASWTTREAFFSPPQTQAWGSLVGAWAPVVGEHGAMLGWLVLNAPVSRWLAVQAQARVQVFALVGLGAGLLVLAERNRRRARRLLAAEEAATRARAADEAKTAVLAQVSHELRTPIQSLLGYAELLRNSALSPQQARWVQAQASHGELLLRLVTDLLDAIAIEREPSALRGVPGELIDTIREVAQSLELFAREKQLQLRLELPEEASLWVVFDSARVRQVVQNLVRNAIKYTTTGHVAVGLTVRAVEATHVACTLTVTDTGPGIAPECQAELFQPFVRLGHTHVEGAGLGLMISRALCRAMGGDLTLSSDGRHGCTFTACWRLAVAPTPASPPRAIEPGWPECAGLAGRAILIAEDSELVRTFLCDALVLGGARVVAVADGRRALEAAARETFSAVVLDLSMPELGGEDTARELRQRGFAGRIVGVSAHADRRDQARALAAGMDAFLTKPVKVDELWKTVALAPAREEPRSLDELRQRLRQQFVAEAPGLRERLLASCHRGDWTAVENHAHTLKGAAVMLGFDQLGGACERLRGAIQRPAYSDAEAVVLEIERELLGLSRVGAPS